MWPRRWLHSPDPLRVAVMARRIVLSLVTLVDREEGAPELEAVADAFEEWAVGLLNACDDSDEAEVALTAVPVVRDPQGAHRTARALSLPHGRTRRRK